MIVIRIYDSRFSIRCNQILNESRSTPLIKPIQNNDPDDMLAVSHARGRRCVASELYPRASSLLLWIDQFAFPTESL